MAAEGGLQAMSHDLGIDASPLGVSSLLHFRARQPPAHPRLDAYRS